MLSQTATAYAMLAIRLISLSMRVMSLTLRRRALSQAHPRGHSQNGGDWHRGGAAHFDSSLTAVKTSPASWGGDSHENK